MYQMTLFVLSSTKVQRPMQHLMVYRDSQQIENVLEVDVYLKERVASHGNRREREVDAGPVATG
jgi:hypothetical protein